MSRQLVSNLINWSFGQHWPVQVSQSDLCGLSQLVLVTEVIDSFSYLDLSVNPWNKAKRKILNNCFVVSLTT